MDWKAVVGSVAPTIATALGGPLAGLGMKALTEVFGLSPEAGEKDIAKAVLGASPDQLLALKKEDNAFALRMRELDVDLEKLAQQDRDSARKREVDSGDSLTPRLLAFLIVGIWMFAEWHILNYSIEASMREIATAGLRTIDNALVLMLGYYFGSMNRGAK